MRSVRELGNLLSPGSMASIAIPSLISVLPLKAIEVAREVTKDGGMQSNWKPTYYLWKPIKTSM
jgi:hypothetical protein